MTKIIAVLNHKGGVGKTTSTYNIGVELAKAFDKRVLLIDLGSRSAVVSEQRMHDGSESIDR